MHSIHSVQRSLLIVAAAGVAAVAFAGCAMNPAPAASVSTAATTARVVTWGPAPAVFEPGAQMAVLQGDPSQGGPFTVRLRFPDGYKVAPHTHPTDEHVAVIEGNLMVGMGGTFDEAATTTLKTGGTVNLPAQHPHYVKAVGWTTVQIEAVGPFALTYVNPSDMPKAPTP